MVDELQNLCHKGVRTFDSHSNNSFNMHVVLLWTIYDFSTYGVLSGCKTKRKFGCPCCGPNTDSLRLPNGKKKKNMSIWVIGDGCHFHMN